MNRWEYTTRFTYSVTIPSGRELECVDLGSRGRNRWQLVQVILGEISTKAGTTEGWVCIYKRHRRWWQR